MALAAESSEGVRIVTVIPYTLDLINENDSAVKLARYAQLIGRAEEQFFGINRPETQRDGTCSPIYTLPMRQMVARYLAEAQEEIEQVVEYPLSARWFLAERHPYQTISIITKWGKLLAAGFQNATVISASAALSHAADPATATVATTVTDTDEIVVYHPGTEIQIIPSSVVIAGGNVTIAIPRARLVKSTDVDNDEQGLDYTDVPPSATSPFEATVDIYRVYNDESVQGGLIYPHRNSGSSDCLCGCSTGCLTCDPYTENACEYIRHAEYGYIDVLPASYTAPDWTAACPICYCTVPEYVHLNYKAGLETLTPQIEDAIVRLAHAKMPSPPCGCGVVHEMWSRDRNIPETFLPLQRLQNPFGVSDGAWFAWRQAVAIRLQRGMALG